MIKKTLGQLLTQLTKLQSQRSKIKLSDFEIANQYEWTRTALTYSSNAIEGNTLTHAETSIVLNDGISLAGKKIIEIQETMNHARAVDYIKKLSQKIAINEINQEHIRGIHECILHDITTEYAGVYRNIPVRIKGSMVILPNHAKVASLMNELVQRIKTTKDHPCIIACELHYHFVRIHPFVDGNGRTARLLANLVLLIAGYPIMIIYPEQREEYIATLEKRHIEGVKEPYQEFMLGCIQKSTLDQIDFYKRV